MINSFTNPFNHYSDKTTTPFTPIAAGRQIHCQDASFVRLIHELQIPFTQPSLKSFFAYPTNSQACPAY